LQEKLKKKETQSWPRLIENMYILILNKNNYYLKLNDSNKSNSLDGHSLSSCCPNWHV